MKKRPLNTRQKRFIENHILKGMSIAESVRRAGYLIRSGRSEDYSSVGCRLLKTPRVASEVERLREKSFTKQALTLMEKRAFIGRAIRTPVGELHEGSDLAQEVTIIEGKEGTMKKIKALDKARLLEIDNKMAGHEFRDREPQANNSFLFLVNLGKAGSLGSSSQVSLPSPAPVIEAQAVEVAESPEEA
jgi:hypothetical protein